MYLFDLEPSWDLDARVSTTAVVSSLHQDTPPQGQQPFPPDVNSWGTGAWDISQSASSAVDTKVANILVSSYDGGVFYLMHINPS